MRKKRFSMLHLIAAAAQGRVQRKLGVVLPIGNGGADAVFCTAAQCNDGKSGRLSAVSPVTGT